MSKFTDKLNQVSRTTPQSIGFKRAQLTLEKPKILLVASLADVSEGLANYVEANEKIGDAISKRVPIVVINILNPFLINIMYIKQHVRTPVSATGS